MAVQIAPMFSAKPLVFVVRFIVLIYDLRTKYIYFVVRASSDTVSIKSGSKHDFSWGSELDYSPILGRMQGQNRPDRAKTVPFSGETWVSQ
jgi:hypothetical protein